MADYKDRSVIAIYKGLGIKCCAICDTVPFLHCPTWIFWIAGRSRNHPGTRVSWCTSQQRWPLCSRHPEQRHIAWSPKALLAPDTTASPPVNGSEVRAIRIKSQSDEVLTSRKPGKKWLNQSCLTFLGVCSLVIVDPNGWCHKSYKAWPLSSVVSSIDQCHCTLSYTNTGEETIYNP